MKNGAQTDRILSAAHQILELSPERRNVSTAAVLKSLRIRSSRIPDTFETVSDLARSVVEDINRVTSLRAVAPNGVEKVFNAVIDRTTPVEFDSQAAPAPAATKPKLLKSTGQVFSDEARSWHSAFLGKTGSGKTYAARGEVEDLLRAGRQVVVIDPTGAWHGLRMDSNGRPSGLDVAVFGGSHGDRPLTPDMAASLGRVAGTGGRSMILDLSGISLELEDQREIVFQFLRNLYRTNRSIIHLVIDEADEWAPQELDKETKPLRSLVARIMSRGRSMGFRCTLITQRPAKIDKNSISQIESMAVLRVTAPQDRKAIVEWFADKGGSDRKEILDGLGSLSTGEGWVFTGLDGTYEHRRFRRIDTWDSSSTPQDDDGAARLDMGKIDLADFDEALTYPDADDDEELEKIVTRRRDLESENARLRVRVLRAESRYEAMRRVFVQFRASVDAALVDDPMDAVDYADLLLLRDEVADDAARAQQRVDLHDVSGVPATIDTPSGAAAPESVPDVFHPTTFPDRPLSPTDRDVIAEIAKQPCGADVLKKRTRLSDKVLSRCLERLIDEKVVNDDGDAYTVTTDAFARQLSPMQARVLKALDQDPSDPLLGFKPATRLAVSRLGLVQSSGALTERGRDALTRVSAVFPHWVT